jgi:hypothetical protein
MKHHILFLSAIWCCNPIQAAFEMNAGITYTENFDAMGIGNTIPDHWLITFNEDFTYPPNTLADTSNSTMFQASGGTPTTPGTYNFGNGSDRAIGVIPNIINYPANGSGDESSLLILHLNINDPTITGLEIGFDLETYYIGDSSEAMILGLWSSSQVATDWNAVTSIYDPSYIAGHYFGATPSKSVSATLSASEFALGDLYLIYQFNGMARSGNALDNVSITAIPEPAALAMLVTCSCLMFLFRRRKI